jgi:hypothetical protein
VAARVQAHLPLVEHPVVVAHRQRIQLHLVLVFMQVLLILAVAVAVVTHNPATQVTADLGS